MNPSLLQNNNRYNLRILNRKMMDPTITKKETIRGGSSSKCHVGTCHDHNDDDQPFSCFLRYGASGMKGHRPTMEDAHICCCDYDNEYSYDESELQIPHHSLFCVLDGHGGEEASQFASEELIQQLCSTEEWQTYVDKIRPYLPTNSSHPNQKNSHSKKKKGNKSNSNDDDLIPTSKMLKELTLLLEKAMIRTFVELDREFYMSHSYGLEQQQQQQQEDGGGLPFSSPCSPGSTAVAVLVTPFTMICANIGDSRCVLATSSTATPRSVVPIALSEDHKPTLPNEMERIQKAGGYVAFDRVDGELAVSRAIGDFELKNTNGLLVPSSSSSSTQDDDDNNNNNQCCYDPTDPTDVETLLERAQQQKVSAYPEIRVHQRDDTTDRFLVLGCDGIFDVCSNEDCVGWISTLLQQPQPQSQPNGNDEDEKNDDIGRICEQMLDKCLQLGSEDNMTIIIVLLEAGQKLIGRNNNNNKKKKGQQRR